MAIASSSPSPGPLSPEVQAAISAIVGGGKGGAANAGMVYMGSFRVKQGIDPETKKPVFGQQSRWMRPDEALNDFYNWSERQRGDFTSQLIVGGLLPAGSGPLEAEEGWRKLVESAAKYGAQGKQVSPYDLLTSYVKAAGGASKNAWKNLGAFEVNTVTGEKRYAGPGVYLGNGRAQQTDTRTDLTDPDTAKAIATKLFQDLMGRDPGAGELGAFGKALATAEAANPVTQTTTTTYNMETGQPISQDTQSHGGLTAEGRAYIGEQQVKKKPEYGATQAATTYQNAFENLIFGSPE